MSQPGGAEGGGGGGRRRRRRRKGHGGGGGAGGGAGGGNQRQPGNREDIRGQPPQKQATTRDDNRGPPPGIGRPEQGGRRRRQGQHDDGRGKPQPRQQNSSGRTYQQDNRRSGGPGDQSRRYEEHKEPAPNAPYDTRAVQAHREADQLAQQMQGLNIGDEKVDAQMAEYDTISVISSGQVQALLPKRPKAPGNKGRQILVETNSYAVKMHSNYMFMYDIKFHDSTNSEIPQDARLLRMELYRSFLSQLDPIYGPTAFDNTRIWAMRDGPKAQDFRNHDGVSAIVTKVSHIDLNRAPHDLSMQLCHIVLGKVLKAAKMIRIGRSHFFGGENADQYMKIPAGRSYPALRVWRGYDVSMEPGIQTIMMKVDVTHKVFQSQSVAELFGTYNPRSAQVDFSKDVIGSCVITLYNKRVWRITSIDWNLTIDSTFDCKGKKISYKEYYEKNYNVILKGAPFMLIHKPKKAKKGAPPFFVLPPEACYLTGLTKKMKADFHCMKAVRGASSLAPRDRIAESHRVAKIIAHKAYQQNTLSAKRAAHQDSIRSDNLEIPMTIDARNSMEVTARVLDPTRVSLEQGRRDDVCVAGDLMKKWRGQLYSCDVKPVKKWAIVYDASCYDHANDLDFEIKNMCGRYRLFGRLFGQQFEFREVPSARGADATARNFGVVIREVARQGFEFAWVILPRFGGDLVHQTVKINTTLSENTLVTQCIKHDKLRGRHGKNNKAYQIVGSCLRQIAAKLGMLPWRLRLPLIDASLNTKALTMIVGVDVNHDVKRNVSTSVFVSSHSILCEGYTCQVDVQKRGQEPLKNAKTFMKQAVSAFKKKNGRFPQQIIVYRDGISNSMIDQCVVQECQEYEASFEEIKGDYKPKMSVIVVQKRVSAKFVEKNQNKTPPGTIVDTGVVSSAYWDFYAVSTVPPPGCTATPTRYIVIWDTIGFSSNAIQEYTFSLCHLFYNWTGSIRVPAPVQCAHTLAHQYGTNVGSDDINCHVFDFAGQFFL